MANKIDQFVKALITKNADAVVFSAGQPVKLKAGGAEKVILNKEVKGEQIAKLVLPLSAEAASALAAGAGSFNYESEIGTCTVHLRGQGDTLCATLTPVGGSPAGAAAPAAAAPEPVSAPAPAAAPPPAAVPAPEPQITASGDEPKINKVLRALVANGGSDLHLSADHQPKIRVDGSIRDLEGFPVLSGEVIDQWMSEVAAEDTVKQFRETNDADYAHEIEGIARFRMNWFMDRLGISAVMRTIPSKVLTAEQLGLPEAVLKLCYLPKGLVVVTGPTGSGKSTTLAAMVDHINKNRTDHILTVEDPVEFVHKSLKCLVNQREVGTHTVGFHSALRAALREDPDIVLVGEMRDLETVAIAIETAATGHLVFGTLHTNTAPSTVDRIIDQFPTEQQAQIRVMLSESLKGVIAQTLCKRIGGGRVACLEILVCSAATANLIREGKTFQLPSQMQTSKNIGCITGLESMLKMVKDKLVDPNEAVLKSADPAAMKVALEREGYKPTAAVD